MILGYCRVSSQGQTDGSSPEEQERAIRGLAQFKGAHAFDVAVFHDTISGAVPLADRPGGREMLDTAKQGDTLVAVKLDRMFRSARDALVQAEEFKARGIELILTDLGTDPITSNGVSKLIFGILSMVAEFEKERINDRMRSGFAAKRAANGHLGGKPPYGWKVVGRSKTAMLTPVPKEHIIIKRIHELKGTGISLHAICRVLDREKLHPRYGRGWRITQISRILRRGGSDGHSSEITVDSAPAV